MRTASKICVGLAFGLFAITMAWSQTPLVPVSPVTAPASPGNSGVVGASSDVAPLIAGEEYTLGPGDVITVSLYGEPDMSRDCSIRGDGSIFLAMLRDKVQAGGRTTEQLQQQIEEAYRSEKLLKNPLVTVAIKEFRSAPVTITGYVFHPTTIQVQGRTTLLQALTMAGGLAANAGTKILVSHASSKDAAGITAPGQTEVIAVRNLYDHPDDKTVNVMLRGGDVVTVQRTDYVYIGGAVTKPGMLAINEVDDWTVLKALAAVGNLTKVAKKDASVIIRKKADGTTETIPLLLSKVLKHNSADIVLQPNDLVLIPESAGLKALYAAGNSLNGVTGGVVTGLAVR
jgi:polysaccharide biosynthesis/export protein